MNLLDHPILALWAAVLVVVARPSAADQHQTPLRPDRAAFNGEYGIGTIDPGTFQRVAVRTEESIERLAWLAEASICAYHLDVWHLSSEQGYADVFFPPAATATLNHTYFLSDPGLLLLHSVPIADPLPNPRRRDDNVKTMKKLNAFHRKYHSLEEVDDFLDRLVDEHPNVTQVTTLGLSAEGREMRALTIGRAVEETPAFIRDDPVHRRRDNAKKKRGRKLGFVIMGPQHAREWIGTASALYFAHALASNNSDMGLMGDLLDLFTFYIIPVPNPDGYAYTWDPQGDRFWYKNRQMTEPDQDAQCLGIDMNRNWGYKWKKTAPHMPTGPTILGDVRSSGEATNDEAMWDDLKKKKKAKKPPASPCSQWYPGHRPFESPEVNNIANFIATLPDLEAFAELRSYGQMLSTPYSFSCKKQPAHSEDQLEAAVGAVSAMKKSYGTVYTAGRLCETLYPARGNVLDWVHAKAGVKYAFAAHLRDTGTYGFALPEEWIRPVGEETADMIRYIAEFIDGIHKSVDPYCCTLYPATIAVWGALLFDSIGQLLYSNPSLEAWAATHAISGGDLISQVTTRLHDFADVPSRLVTKFPQAGPGSALLWTVTGDGERVLVVGQDHQSQNVLSVPEPTARPMIRLPWYEQKRFICMQTGGGEMGDLVRGFDWASTSLGALETWSQSLVSFVGCMLRNPTPMSLYVGEEHLVMYNDAFKPVLGPGKHPRSLGRPAEEVWAEIWDSIEVPLRQALQGRSYYRENDLLFFDRLSDGPNSLEEVYASWSYTPIYDDYEVIAIQLILYEQSQKQDPIGMRRISTLSDLGSRLLSARRISDLCRMSCDVLRQLDHDLPYCLAYTRTILPTDDDAFNTSNSSSVGSASMTSNSQASLESTRFNFSLEETVGCSAGCALAPMRIDIDIEDEASPTVHDILWDDAIRKMCRTGTWVEAQVLDRFLADVPHRGVARARPSRAICIPLKHGCEVLGCTIFLLNPAAPWGPQFKAFMSVLERQLSLSATMVKSYEDEVRRSEELAALDRAKTAFFTGVSHELRTPLTLILGPAQVLGSDTRLTPSQQAQISLITGNAKRLLRLVNSILEFSRAEAGKLSARFTPVSLGKVTAELVCCFRSAIENAGMELKVDNRASDDCLVWVDTEKWEQIVFNIMSNAFKFTFEGGIHAHIYAHEDEFFFEISDTGIGIQKEHLGTIFDRFTRIENLRARSVEGSGIGLSLTAELVKAHGGKITVKSVPDKGSTFQIRLPLGYSHLPSHSLLPPSEEKGSSRNDSKVDVIPDSMLIPVVIPSTEVDPDQRWSDEDSGETTPMFPPIVFGNRARARILLADDNADMRTFIRSILSRYWDVCEVGDGQAAWEMLQADPNSYDLLISDVIMPRMDGQELVKAIRSDERFIGMRIILLSAYAGEKTGIESLIAGADDHLTKPFSTRELLLRSHAHLQWAAIQSELRARVEERTQALEESRETFRRLSDLLQEWPNVLHPDDREHAVQLYLKAIAEGVGFSVPLETRIRDRLTGLIVDIAYDLQPELDGDGECTGFVGVFTDITMLRELQRESMASEQAENREEAEQNRQLQEQFIDITCHELRNPLNAISNCAELLGESLRRIKSIQEHLRQDPRWSEFAEFCQPLQADLDEDLEAVETIILCSRHQKRIAEDDVLHISKLSGHLITLVDTEFDAEETIQCTIKQFALEVRAKHIDLIYERDSSLDHIGAVVGDEGRFNQMSVHDCLVIAMLTAFASCVNLLSNAIKFTENMPTRRIRVRLGATRVIDDPDGEQDDGAPGDELLPLCKVSNYCTNDSEEGAPVLLHVAVSDTGHGMTAEEQSRIFRRFAQASPKTYREFGGIGLGLWISRSFAVNSEHSEVVTVETVFRFHIKVKRGQLDRIHESSDNEASGFSILTDGFTQNILPNSHGNVFVHEHQQHSSRPRVLVVEDNKINQKLLSRILRGLDCDVITANDGADCIAKIDALICEPDTPAFDLILMDLEMPVIDGLQATQKIRAAEADGRYPLRHRIVAVTANARQQYADMSSAMGMDGFLRKPYSKAEVAEIVRTFTSR
ncbi:hypothetical protein PUNSTDRAFT_146276 [Punctularia strigosozonata HHB-11173 SS5]|uniref:histidine kinase n=1 Tax=Punctularia strigosozonata (strain HHB-11173) TaxID=741275 RepID=R7S406_PUNST|nr:uncharacterized protein PUNSTDRAFT_146276 [Punctularia strigosozonata HHB-11173 SS5]EIN04589.1 hypothetical protein PUNSTDRAFT_146276 [Punctularia strigosozonata HHB-11173 SS5]